MNNIEYSIFITCKGGKTYNLLTYYNLFEAKHALYNLIILEKERGRPYYVHNDFYENEYPASISGKIFCLKQRKISNWENYSSKKNSKKNLHNNIYKFPEKTI